MRSSDASPAPVAGNDHLKKVLGPVQLWGIAANVNRPRPQGGRRQRLAAHAGVRAGGVVGIVAIFSDTWLQFGGQTLTANVAQRDAAAPDELLSSTP